MNILTCHGGVDASNVGEKRYLGQLNGKRRSFYHLVFQDL